MIFGILYSPVLSSFAVRWRSTAGMFIDEFQLMLAMYMNSTSTGYGSAVGRVGDDHVHQAVGGERRVPGIGLVDALRLAVGVDQQILRALAGSRAARPSAACSVRSAAPGRLRRRRRARERRLVAEAAGAIDRAQQDLQQMQHAGRSGSRWNAPRCRAWRASTTGRPTVLSWRRPVAVGPGNVERDLLLERGMRQFARRCAGSCRPGSPVAAATFSGAYSSAEKPLGDQRETRAARCGRRRA